MIKILKSYDEKEIFERGSESANVSEIVSDIVSKVKLNGDVALKEYSSKFDKVELESFEISLEFAKEAYDRCDDEFKAVLDEAALNIREYHSAQKGDGYEINRNNGVKIGRKVIPLERVAVYVPGGTAAYPS
jgi:histidinol dehydrogenase